MQETDWDFHPSLGSDNHSGVHPKIIQAIIDVNRSHSPAYGTDKVTEDCQKRFQQLFGENCNVFFVFNGTAANVLSLSSLVHSWHGIICSDISHLQLDECGAPEKTIGCKLITLPNNDGKISAHQIRSAIVRRGDQHSIQPGAVSITQPTEVGTVYSLSELEDIHKVCLEFSLKLHIDGARLLLASHFLNCEFIDIVRACRPDAISFGGTKNGLLAGEAVLLFDELRAKEFKFLRKQSMQLPSKMRFISAQFLALFNDNLYKKIAKKEHELALYFAERLKDFEAIKLAYPVESNAVFPIFPKKWTKQLKKQMFFYIWDEKKWVARWMMGFDSKKSDIDLFVSKIQLLHQQQE